MENHFQLSEHQEYSKPLKNNGFVKLKKFLNDEEALKVKKIIKHYNSTKGLKETHFSSNIKSHIIKILKLDIKKLFDSNYFLKLEKKKEINKIANLLFEKKSFLQMIDGYCSPISDKEVLPWHCDQAYTGIQNVKTFNHPDHFNYKFFIYLTKVGPNNGCTSYIKGSHKVTYVLRKGIYEKKINYQPYCNLVDLVKTIKIKNNYEYIKDYISTEKNLTEKELEDFFNYSELAIKGLDNNQFDFSAEAGDAIIFNDGGVHRGSKILESERIVLRYLYSTKIK